MAFFWAVSVEKTFSGKYKIKMVVESVLLWSKFSFLFIDPDIIQSLLEEVAVELSLYADIVRLAGSVSFYYWQLFSWSRFLLQSSFPIMDIFPTFSLIY